jgi:acetyl/propionyl-CoA carboxylase alpha subunit
MAQVTALGCGVYRVDVDGQQTIVYVAGAEGDLWAFCDGRIYREREAAAKHGAMQMLTAPMPATVVKVLVAPGQAVHRGDTLVVLEAMKMELPIRAPADAVVKAVNCREGELVQPGRTLVELA